MDDHHEQRRLFAILEEIDPADDGTLEAIWARLSAFLEVHAAAEEEIFYPELLRVGISAGRAPRRRRWTRSTTTTTSGTRSPRSAGTRQAPASGSRRSPR